LNGSHRASALMVGASALFALMGACVKLASEFYGAGEIVMARSLIGLLLMAAALRLRRIPLRSTVPQLHLARSISGTVALCLWFTSIAGLPLATATTLNYMSSVWIALFLIGGAVLVAPERGGSRPDGRLTAAVLAGFAGVALVLRPTISQDQLLHGLLGLASGLLSAVAYLQVTSLGRIGEPGERVVFYFSLTGVVFGAAYAAFEGFAEQHHAEGLLLLLAIGTLATAAQWMMTRAYATGATLGIAALQYLGIVFASLIGIVLFAEQLPAVAWAGIALILAAGVAATLLRGRVPGRDAPAGDD
jgi:drug/metabolite transporter (DMT)-like permease